MKRISYILTSPWTALVLMFGVISATAQTNGTFRNLGPDINTEGDEYLPVIYNDTLYFRRSIGRESHEILLTGVKGFNCMNDILGFELFNTKTYSNSLVEANRSIRSNLSSPSFTNYSDTIQLWAPSKEMEELSSEGHDFHPAFSITGDTLVFASTRPDPNGQSDLYVSVKRANGKWSRPRKLPRGINSTENEISPYIAPDGTLYYASKGFTSGRATVAVSGKSRSSNSNLFFRESALNFDIIKAELGDNFWTDPVKLPYPINTEFDDIGPTTYEGKIFLSSNRPTSYDWGHGYGGFDLYGWCDDNCCDSTCVDLAIIGEVGGNAYEATPYAVVEIVQIPEENVIRTIVLENQRDYYVEVPHHSEYAVRTYHNCLLRKTKYTEETFEHLCNTCCLDTFLIKTKLEGGCPNCDNTNSIAGMATCGGEVFVCGSYVELYDNKFLLLGTAEIDSTGKYEFLDIDKKDEYSLRFYSDCLKDTMQYIEKFITDLSYTPTGDGKKFTLDFEIPEGCCLKCPNVFLRGRTMCSNSHTYDYSTIIAFDKYGNNLGETLTNRYGEFNIPISQVCPTDSITMRLVTDCVTEGFVEKKVAFDCVNDSMNIIRLDFDHPRNCCVSCENLMVEGRIQGKGVNIGLGMVEFYRNFAFSDKEKISEIIVNEDGSFFADIPYWPEYTVQFYSECLQDTMFQVISADFPCEKGESQYLYCEFDISNTPCAEDVCTDVIHNFSTKSFNIFVENGIELALQEGNKLPKEAAKPKGLSSLRSQVNTLSNENKFSYNAQIDKAINEGRDVIIKALTDLAECPECNYYEITVTGYNDTRTSNLKNQKYYGQDISNGDILLLPYSVIMDGMIMNDILIGELRAYNLVVELQRKLLDNEKYIDFSDRIIWKAVGAPEVITDNNTGEIRVKCSSAKREMKKLKLTKRLPRYLGAVGTFDGKGQTTYSETVSSMIEKSIVGKKDEFDMLIFYGFDNANLTTDSYKMIDEIIAEMKKRPNLEIEIQGYTDNIGTMEYNLNLSELRAKKVYDTIIKRGGIDPNRLRYRAMSYMNPQASNATEEGRAKNRRTMFKVLKK